MDRETAKANQREAWIRQARTFEGMPCVRCGETLRKTGDGRCDACHRADSVRTMTKLRNKKRKVKKAKE